MTLADEQRQLKIKTGVVTRTTKEMQSYNKELASQTKRVEALKADGADSHEIRQQERVLEETVTMLPDCHRRLTKAVTELREFLTAKADVLQDSAEREEALNAIDVADQQLAK